MIEFAEVWCENDANPTHAVVDGHHVCVTCEPFAVAEARERDRQSRMRRVDGLTGKTVAIPEKGDPK